MRLRAWLAQPVAEISVRILIEIHDVDPAAIDRKIAVPEVLIFLWSGEDQLNKS
jgi:hypothetical protein